MTSRNETPDQAARRAIRRVKLEGLDAAVSAAIEIARDPKAPSQARAAAVNALLRAGGLFGKPADEDEGTPAHEMTYAQLQRALARAQQQPDQEDDDNVFG